MRSRYSAYAVGESRYIIATTHLDNPDYREPDKAWREEIDLFCRETEFLELEILAATEGEAEATVTFKAKLSSGEMIEKSRFLKEEGRWFYESGMSVS
jgi:SEC-C motif-containing protein